MNREINSLLKKYDLKPIKYSKCGKVLIIYTKDKKYVIKKKENNSDIFRYLYSRNFDYLPSYISDKNDLYDITEFIEEIEMPNEQKINDLIDLLSLLHLKTTYFKNVDNEEYLHIYDDLNNNIIYLNMYYEDIINKIESRVFMSPSEYLLARNYSILLKRLNNVKEELDKWYELVKNKDKVRFTILHNNLEISHFLRSDIPYLISWNKSKLGMPIFDLYNLFIKNNNIDFLDLLLKYESKYPLLKEERLLLYILIRMPILIEDSKDEYTKTINVKKMINLVISSEKINLPNDSKNDPYKDYPKEKT